MNEVISPEELQKFQELESSAATIIQVSVPAGTSYHMLRLNLTFRRLGPPPPGSGLTTREDIVVGLERAEAVVAQITRAIAEVK